MKDMNGSKMNRVWDIAVIGGGPAGLAAAALSARSGRSVVLLEKGSSLGGRASSSREGGASLNLGAHALYRGGSAQRVLEKLGVAAPGGSPGTNVAWVPEEGRGEIVSTAGLLLGRTLNWSEKRRFLRFFLGLRKLNPNEATGQGWAAWMAANGLHGRAAAVASALARLSTYVGDADKLDAGTVIRQLQKPAVIYPDGGWQTIVDGLAAKASEAGAVCRTSASVAGVERAEDGTGGWILRLADGECVRTGQVIAAVEPARVADWFGRWLPADYLRSLGRLQPVYASALDLHLRRLPKPGRPFALGLDQPLYFSAHSQWAKLCDDSDHAVIHVMRYDGEQKDDLSTGRASLERFLDRVQPGWRDQVIRARYMPHVTVMHGMPSRDLKGTMGRPSVDTGLDGVYVAGDWTGGKEALLDASMYSADAAAELAVKTRAIGVNAG